MILWFFDFIVSLIFDTWVTFLSPRSHATQEFLPNQLVWASISTNELLCPPLTGAQALCLRPAFLRHSGLLASHLSIKNTFETALLLSISSTYSSSSKSNFYTYTTTNNIRWFLIVIGYKMPTTDTCACDTVVLGSASCRRPRSSL